MLFSADFETITDENDCRVWAWGICDIPYTFANFGNSIDSFFEHLKTLKENSKIYFHNLKFDGSFILNYLLFYILIVNNLKYRQQTSSKKKSSMNFLHEKICQ